MKDIYKINIFLLLLINSFYSLDPNAKKVKTIPEIKIYSSHLNTIANFKDEKELYFSFDFENYIKESKSKNDSIYFQIITEEKFKSVSHSFTNEEISNISYTRIKGNESLLIWENSQIEDNLEINNNFVNVNNYYIRINRNSLDKDKKTLIIKISILSKKGIFYIKHIKSLPYSVAPNLEDPTKKLKDGLISQFKKFKNINSNRKGNYKKKYNKKFEYKTKKRNKNRQMRLIFGAILLSLWSIIFIGYFLVNRRQKILFITNYNQNISYMNI